MRKRMFKRKEFHIFQDYPVTSAYVFVILLFIAIQVTFHE